MTMIMKTMKAAAQALQVQAAARRRRPASGLAADGGDPAGGRRWQRSPRRPEGRLKA